MIACSNIKGQNYQGLNKRSTDNAKWSNLVSLQLTPGDMISVENTTLNLRGISSDSTVELLNQDNEHGLSDAKMGIRFTGYVNDNGQNTIALPFVGTDQDFTYPLKNVGDDWPRLEGLKYAKTGGDENVNFKTASASITNADDTTAPYNALEPNTGTNYYEFKYFGIVAGDGMQSPFHNNLKTYYAEKPSNGTWNSVSGHKYTLIDENYIGPFRKDDKGNFWSGEDDFKPQYFDVKIDLNAPLYESPSTIAAEINNQLNDTDVYGDSNIEAIVRDLYSQPHKLPSLTGSLLKTRKCNGFIDYDYDQTQDPNDGRKKLWGNMAVRDFKKWQGIHALMRCSLAFNNRLTFNDSATNYTQFHPSFLMPSGQVRGATYYPRVTVPFAFKTIGFGSDAIESQSRTTSFYYTTVPQYYVMCTSILYTEDNLKKIQLYLTNNERYDGTWTTNEDIQYRYCKLEMSLRHRNEPPRPNYRKPHSGYVSYWKWKCGPHQKH